MTKAEQIREAIKLLASANSGDFANSAILQGTVLSVSDDVTADVEVDGLTYHDVQLQAVQNGSGKSLVLVPSSKTKCLIGSIENGDRFYMLACDEIEKVIAKIQGADLLIDNNGLSYQKNTTKFVVEGDSVEIKVGANSLGSLIDELISAILKITVNAAGVATTTPTNSPEFVILKTKFKTLLK